MVETDPFCLDEKNLVIPRKELAAIIEPLFWVNINLYPPKSTATPTRTIVNIFIFI